MDVLILGFSSLVQRRVAPALRALPTIGRVDLATHKAAGRLRVEWGDGALFEDYQQALERSNAELVYVSQVNSEHVPWTHRALEAGKHVVVDKPAFLGTKPTEAVLNLAARCGRCIAEATVWTYHPQVLLAQQLFAKSGAAPKRITAEFCFPALETSNFRHQRALGGGALWDVGPYAVTVGRVFYGEEPQDLACRILEYDGPDHLETAFSILATYSGGRSVVGQYGFNSVYRNRLDLLGESLGVEIDRVFTTPPDLVNDLRVTMPTGVTTEAAPAGDAFALFFDHVRERIEAGDWSGLTADLLSDARVLDRLRQTAGVE
jgi:predicted dehydrogenase